MGDQINSDAVPRRNKRSQLAATLLSLDKDPLGVVSRGQIDGNGQRNLFA